MKFFCIWKVESISPTENKSHWTNQLITSSDFQEGRLACKIPTSAHSFSVQPGNLAMLALLCQDSSALPHTRPYVWLLGVFASGGSAYAGLMPECIEFHWKVITDPFGPYFLGTIFKFHYKFKWLCSRGSKVLFYFVFIRFSYRTTVW